MIANVKYFYFFGAGGLHVTRLIMVKGGNQPKKCLMMFFFHFQAWRDATYLEKQPLTSSGRPKWSAPPEDVYKINCDGAFIPGSNNAGWGFVIRDHFGMVIATGAGLQNHVMSATHAEAIACLRGLEYAADLGLRHAILETDAAVIAEALRNKGVDRSVLGTLIDEIKSLMYYEFAVCSIFHVPRACNAVADTLAAIGLNCMDGSRLWYDSVPDSVALLVSGDLPSTYD